MYRRTLPGRLSALFLLLCATAAPAEPFTFGVIGDYGTNNTAERDVANLVKSWNPSFILTLGDNNYSSSPTSWDPNIGQYYHEYIYNYKGQYGAGSPTRRFFPNIGNHDYDAGIDGYLDFFDLPGNERYYSYRHGPVEVFVLNSNPGEPDGISKTSKQATWLQSVMAASDANWKIVSLHHPPYASGGTSSTMRWPFEQWGADVVMAGHLHNYERLHVGNIDFFINGLGGAGISGFGTTAEGSQIRYNATHGAMKVIADDTFLHFQFINKTGQIIDDYTLGVVPGPVPKFWNTSITSGAWNVAANWSPAGVPAASQDCFVIHQDGTNRTVNYINPTGATTQFKSLTVESRSTGMMTLKQSQDTLSVLSLNVATTANARGTFEKTAGTLAADQVVNRGTFTHSGGTMRVAKSFDNTGGVATIAADHRWAAGAKLTVSAGTVHLNTTATNDATTPLAIDVRSGATAHINAPQRLKSLTIAGDVAVGPAGNHLLHTDALTLATTGKLDLADNALVVRSTAATQAADLARIEALIARARNANATHWTAPGLTSSAARANPDATLAIIPNPGLATFSGEVLGAHDILVKYTWNGDANLDGRVNSDDYFRVDAGFLGNKVGFANGDFNYDGTVNSDDYFLIDSAFLARTTSATLAAATAAINPEPTMLPLVLALATMAMRRRRD